MRIFKPIDGNTLEGLCKILGETSIGLKGYEIEKFLSEVGIIDTDPGITKWKRLYNAFVHYQNKSQISNNILKFINKSMSPSRFIGNNEKFEDLRFSLNRQLSFIGLEFLPTGKFKSTEISSTIAEAEQKAHRLKNKLEQRNAHPIIFKYCNAELLAENYFHTVFEAVKSIAEIIRQKSFSNLDGGELIDYAFSVNKPILKINDLSTETRKSEQKGFANFIKGIFGMFRNTTAHAPKITWEINEEDALDILSTISLVHRKLDNLKT